MFHILPSASWKSSERLQKFVLFRVLKLWKNASKCLTIKDIGGFITSKKCFAAKSDDSVVETNVFWPISWRHLGVMTPAPILIVHVTWQLLQFLEISFFSHFWYGRSTPNATYYLRKANCVNATNGKLTHRLYELPYGISRIECNNWKAFHPGTL